MRIPDEAAAVAQAAHDRPVKISLDPLNRLSNGFEKRGRGGKRHCGSSFRMRAPPGPTLARMESDSMRLEASWLEVTSLRTRPWLRSMRAACAFFCLCWSARWG